jgi:hypothetical protein
VIQNSLDRLYEGMIGTLRETVAPAVTDPYVRAQVLAMSELLGNLATRTEWRGADLAAVVDRVRGLLVEADRLAPAGLPELIEARTILGGPGPDANDNAALVQARNDHLAALAGVQAWLGASEGFGELRAAVDAFVVELLDEEMARVRTGMYKRSSA